MKRAQHRPHSRGFTLIEVIVSLAVLSIASVFILQLFVTAAQLNDNARDTDQANALITTALEDFIACADPRSFATDAMPHRLSTPEDAHMAGYFDEHWQPCAPEAAAFRVLGTLQLQAAGPSVPLSLSGDGLVAGALYSLSVQVIPAGKDTPLLHSQSSVYFPAAHAQVSQ